MHERRLLEVQPGRIEARGSSIASRMKCRENQIVITEVMVRSARGAVSLCISVMQICIVRFGQERVFKRIAIARVAHDYPLLVPACAGTPYPEPNSTDNLPYAESAQMLPVGVGHHKRTPSPAKALFCPETLQNFYDNARRLRITSSARHFSVSRGRCYSYPPVLWNKPLS